MKILPLASCVALSLLSHSLGLAQQTKSKDMPAPSPLGAVPTKAQMAWQQLETYAFVHFGLNTYNDLEWGYGNTPVSTFNPKELDTDQWVRTLKAAGMKAVLITTKHHDGFCLWPTKTTEYSVKNSPWKNGKGDLVRDLSASCRKYGLKLGIYLSPWDRNHPEYGREGYQQAFHEQIRELTTQYGELFEYWFDGANGGTGWYGGADEKRNIDPKSYYKYEEAAKILRANNPDIMIFGGTVPTIRWVGNEEGWAGETNYSTYDMDKEKHYKENIWGHRAAPMWLPAEVDVSIRPGWFYHPREDHQVRSVANLTNIYYQSVGRNANLLLNFPVNLDGRIPEKDSINAVRWHQHIQRSFKTNLLRGAKVRASHSRRGKAFSTQHLVDGKYESYWATADSAHSSEIVIELKKPTKLNNISLQEYIPLGQRIEAFTLELRNNRGQWESIETADSLSTVGYKRIIRLKPSTTKAIRLRVTKSLGPVVLSEVGAYLAPELVDAPLAYRDEQNRLIIKPAVGRGSTTQQALSYRINGSAWQSYKEPVALPLDHAEVEVEANSGTDRSKASYSFGYSSQSFSVEGIKAEEAAKLRDGNGYTSIWLGKGQDHLDFVFDRPRQITSLVYTPNQGRDAEGHIQSYKVYADDLLVAEGEFQNIKANPIPSLIKFDKTITAKRLRLEIVRILDDRAQASIGDIAIF